ncbi:hypothetical protein CVT25_009491 [Psilocybe cyanescens]|uniref:Uncharacterized protein n=1 Tax=Psilocybe cyanescens TaxID=93625 RepID=A0A409XAN8_PSICY|nr:hypothetical protein CVT25_009491 [Psilocybe cyanescens]
MLSILLTLAASTSFAHGAGVLQQRAAQTSAVCTSDFTWMDNAQSTSPCQVVTQLNAICNNGNYEIPAINATTHYDNPGVNVNSTPISFCTCSWASYNLISACTACQNADFQSKIAIWSDYSSLCSGRLSTRYVFWVTVHLSVWLTRYESYFPSNITLPDGLTIPFWAGQDPTTWPNGRFSLTNAQQIARESEEIFFLNPVLPLPISFTDHADLGQAPPAKKKSTNVGAIVGGVIGGLVVIAAAIAAALYILRRQRQSTAGTLPLSDSSGHMRSVSDVTTSTRAYTTLSSTPFKSPGSPTILTHNTSVRSVPFLSSVAASTIPYGTASPPPRVPLTTTSPPPGNRVEDVIEPFTTPPQQANVSHDRKQSNGSGFPVYDSPSAPPVGGMRMEITRPTTPSQSQRVGRYNPPAYSESSVGHGSRPAHRGKQASSDTLHSLASGRNQGARPTIEHSPSSSGSGMANIVGQMSASNNESSGSGSNTPGHGRQVSTSRDEKRRPPEDESISGRDIA